MASHCGGMAAEGAQLEASCDTMQQEDEQSSIEDSAPQVLSLESLADCVSAGLWSSSSILGSLILSADGSAVQTDVLELYSAALQAEQQYSRSATVCEQLLCRDEVTARSTETRLPHGCASYRDCSAQLRLAQCNLAMGENAAAMAALEAVALERRSAAAHMALGVLYRDAGLENAAIASFKETLARHPGALDALRHLLEL